MRSASEASRRAMTTTSATPLAETTVPRGPAIYFDGTSSARNDVVVEATATGLQILSPGRPLLDEWFYPELRRQSAPDGVLRLGRSGETLLARLEIRDAALAEAIEERAVTLDRSGAAERALRRKVVGLSIAAMVSLIVTAIVGVPVLASRLMPFIPVSVEQKLGNAVDKQVRATLDTKHLGAGFACGSGANIAAGRAALDKLVGKLKTAAALPYPLQVDVVRRADFNAFALPGGHIYVFQGLIDRAQAPDELAGVLSHEIGHVVHRDGTRTVLQAAGLSFLFGMMLGDFVGGGAVVIAAKTVLQSSYSRQVEAAADTYSVGLMGKVGGDPRALATILARVMSDKEEGIKILSDHPDTKDRIVAINAIAPARATTPLLGAADWAALKQICAAPASTTAPASGTTSASGTVPASGMAPASGKDAGGATPAGAGQKLKADSDGATPNH
jgi:Zn-dependent protease with chaperone function